MSTENINVINEIKRYLKSVRGMNEEIAVLQRAKEEFCNSATGVFASGTASVKKDSVIEDLHVKKTVNYIDVTNRIDKKITELIDCREKIIFEIGRLNNAAEQKVLTCRYINCMSWEEISEKLHITVRQLHRIHVNALNSIVKNKKGEV